MTPHDRAQLALWKSERPPRRDRKRERAVFDAALSLIESCYGLIGQVSDRDEASVRSMIWSARAMAKLAKVRATKPRLRRAKRR